MIRTSYLLSWALVGSLVGFLSASCGSDELTEPGDDLNGSSGGAGGGGSGGRGGKAGGSTAGTASKSDLGKPCESNQNCDGLECLSGADVPAGLCTADCVSDADCEQYGSQSACMGSVCFEGCATGGLGVKCQGREDFACRVYEIVDGDRCTTDAQCNSTEFCSNNVCVSGRTACVPTCGSDADCDPGYCSIETGSCQSALPVGLPVGAPCDPDLEADEDPCQGFCVGSDPDTAFCSGWCRFSADSPGCGFSADSDFADAMCLFTSAFQQNAEVGDAGFCGQLCDCDSDCLNPNWSCAPFVAGTDLALFGRRGLCSTPEAGEETLRDCPDGRGGSGAGGESGAGGASGANAGGLGGGGAGGDSGGESASGGTGGTG